MLNDNIFPNIHFLEFHKIKFSKHSVFRIPMKVCSILMYIPGLNLFKCDVQLPLIFI